MQIYISFLYAQWRFIVMRLKEEEDIINEQSHNDEELAEYKYDISKLFNKFKEAEYDDVVIRKRLSKLIAKAEAEAEDSFSSIFDESFPEFPDFVCDDNVFVFKRLSKLIAEAEEDFFSSIFDESPPFEELPSLIWYLRCVFIPITSRAVYIRFIICINIYI